MSSYRTQQSNFWRPLTCLAALCGPQALSAARLTSANQDAWMAPVTALHVNVPNTPHTPMAVPALLATSTAPAMRRQLQVTSAAATDYSGEPQTGDNSYQYVSEASSDQLYSTREPQLSDFLQGNEGDCYFAASLAATIMSDRDFVKGGIVTKGHGSTGNQYQVRFFYKGQAEWYGLDDRFPENSFGTRLGYQQPIVDGKAVAGPALWEKGWVKFNDAHPDVMNKGVKGYPAINGGHGVEALAAITNQTTRYLSPTDAQLMQKLAPVNTGNVNALFAFVTTNLVNTLPNYNSNCSCAKLSDGTVVTDHGDGTIVIAPPKSASISLVDDHMYAVAAVFTNNQTARLFNPWGSNPGASGALVDIAASTLAQVGSYGVIASSTKKPHHGLSKGAIGAIVGGSIAFALAALGLGYWAVRRCQNGRRPPTRPTFGRDVVEMPPQPRIVHWPRADMAEEAPPYPPPLAYERARP